MEQIQSKFECPKCKGTLNESAKICAHCGYAIHGTESNDFHFLIKSPAHYQKLTWITLSTISSFLVTFAATSLVISFQSMIATIAAIGSSPVLLIFTAFSILIALGFMGTYFSLSKVHPMFSKSIFQFIGFGLVAGLVIPIIFLVTYEQQKEANLALIKQNEIQTPVNNPSSTQTPYTITPYVEVKPN